MNFNFISTTFLMISLFLITSNSFAQKKSLQKYNEGTTPKVKIFMANDTTTTLTKLKKNAENKIKVVIEGGIDKVKSEVYVTSKNASIHKVPHTKYEYVIIPQDENCEIIVDIKLHENFLAFKEKEVKGKKVRELEKDYIPKTYMLAYETIPTY